MWDLNKDYGFSTSIKDFPVSDFRTDWNTIGDYSGLSGQPFSSDSRQNDKWGSILEAITKADNWRNKYRDTYGNSATQPYRNPIQFQSNPNVAQIGDGSFLYTPPQQPFTTTGGKSSGSSGLGSTVGQLIGIGGTALGVFGPLGPAAGAAVGGLIDRFV